MQAISQERFDPLPRSGCAIDAAVERLGDPWTILVLRDIVFGNRRRFRELVAGSEEGIAISMLAGRPKQLVAAGRLSGDAARRGQRAAYSLAEAGTHVLPVMVALGNRGLAHRAGSPGRRYDFRTQTWSSLQTMSAPASSVLQHGFSASQ